MPELFEPMQVSFESVGCVATAGAGSAATSFPGLSARSACRFMPTDELEFGEIAATRVLARPSLESEACISFAANAVVLMAAANTGTASFNFTWLSIQTPSSGQWNNSPDKRWLPLRPSICPGEKCLMFAGRNGSIKKKFFLDGHFVIGEVA